MLAAQIVPHPCAWIDRATRAPRPVALPAFAPTVETTATTLALSICADHLGAAVVTAFIVGAWEVAPRVQAVHITRYRAA